jgi:hypothetical protein
MSDNDWKTLAAAVLGGLGGMVSGLMVMDDYVEPESVPDGVILGLFLLMFVLSFFFVAFRKPESRA